MRVSATRYAAILVDLRLRDADGMDLIVQLRAQPHNSKTPVVVISGDPGRGREDVRAPLLDILEWFDKPIDFARLVKVLQTAISAQRARPLVLHVDDDPEVAALVARQLSALADVKSADSLAEALHALAGRHVDLVILDLALGDDSGLDLLPEFRDAVGNPIPVIVFSSHALEAPCSVQIGAALSKANSPLERLEHAVRDRLALLPAQVA